MKMGREREMGERDNGRHYYDKFVHNTTTTWNYLCGVKLGSIILSKGKEKHKEMTIHKTTIHLPNPTNMELYEFGLNKSYFFSFYG